jgi:hypothetical protein
VTSGSTTKRTGVIGRQQVHAEDAARSCPDRDFMQRWLEALFRHLRSPHATAVFRLKGLARDRRYRFEDADSGECREASTRELTQTGLEIRLSEPRSCRLLFYEEKDAV